MSGGCAAGARRRRETQALADGVETLAGGARRHVQFGRQSALATQRPVAPQHWTTTKSTRFTKTELISSTSVNAITHRSNSTRIKRVLT